MAESPLTIIGRLGKDPEYGAAKDGTPRASFSIAVNRYIGKGDKREQKADWRLIIAWGELAKEVMTYLKKGSKVIVQGYLRDYDKTTKSGETYKVYFIQAKEIGSAFNTYATQNPNQGQQPQQKQNQSWNQTPQPYQNGNPYPQQTQNKQWNQSPAAGNFSQFGPAYNEPPEYEQDEIPF